jgi:hypothetical protein
VDEIFKTIELPFHIEGTANPAVFNKKTAVYEANDDTDTVLTYVDTLLKPYGLQVVWIDGGDSAGDLCAFRIDPRK